MENIQIGQKKRLMNESHSVEIIHRFLFGDDFFYDRNRDQLVGRRRMNEIRDKIIKWKDEVTKIGIK